MSGFRPSSGFSCNSGSSGVTSITMTVPIGVVATDNVLICLTTATSTAGGHALTGTTGSGTLSVPSGGLNGQTISTSYKVTTLLGTGHVAGDVLTFSCPASGITTGIGGAWDNTLTFDLCGTAAGSAGTAAVNVPAMTTSVNNSVVICVAVAAQTSARTFVSCTPGTDRFHLDSAGGGTRFTALAFNDQTVSTAGTSGQMTTTFSGALTGSAGIQISMKPAGGATNVNAAVTQTETVTTTAAATVGVAAAVTETTTVTTTAAATVGANAAAAVAETVTVSPTAVVGAQTGVSSTATVGTTATAVVGVQAAVTETTTVTVTAALSVAGSNVNIGSTVTTNVGVNATGVVGVQGSVASSTAVSITAAGVIGAQAGVSSTTAVGVAATAAVGARAGVLSAATVGTTATAVIGTVTGTTVPVALTVNVNLTINGGVSRDITLEVGGPVLTTWQPAGPSIATPYTAAGPVLTPWAAAGPSTE